MTRTVFQDGGLLVADGVLAADTFASLRDEIGRSQFRWVHSQGWDRAWHLEDGHPLRGTPVYFDPASRFGWKGARYPTSTSIDALIDAVRRICRSSPQIAGVEGVDWVGLYLSPWLYPAGSALSLHRDAIRYSGSFAFFAHDRWSTHWGGELLVSGALERCADGADGWTVEDAHEDGDPTGIATCVLPRPNRLVVIGPDRPHRIARIDRNAGSHVRTSVAGFFLREP